MNIFVSSAALKNNSIAKVSKKFENAGIKNIEFSGGLYEEDVLKKLKKLQKKQNILIHNYFPRPKKDFVLNLASANKFILKKTETFIKKSILLCSKLNIKYYSFHAGFLIDPKIRMLGKKIKKTSIQNRDESLKRFILRTNKLARFAKKHNVELLIENNVLSKKNYLVFKNNPLLMTSYQEMIKIMKNTPNNVNLLIDVGHLKVSAKTLKFNMKNTLSKVNKWVKGYHLSENNGLEDSNNFLKSKSWFLKILKTNVDFISLEIYSTNLKRIKAQVNFLKRNLSND